jgi:hypothetical protein
MKDSTGPVLGGARRRRKLRRHQQRATQHRIWCGELGAGERFVKAFRRLAPPIADLLHPRPYPSMYEVILDPPQSVTNITCSFAADDLDDVAIESILQQMQESNRPSTEAFAAVELRVLGVRSAGFLLTPPLLPIASGNCSVSSSRPGSLKRPPTVTARGFSPYRAQSSTREGGLCQLPRRCGRRSPATRPTQRARTVVSSRSSAAMTRRTIPSKPQYSTGLLSGSCGITHFNPK